jgi:outer membrane protein OmpA-like peptidoglycan-associated protein
MCLVLIGFSDPRGPFEYNQKLSLKRAKKVKKELESYGANPSIITVGFGEEPALLRDPRLYIENGELNLDGLQKNRRVEVWLER